MGKCYFKGFVTCPYHGATFDGKGNCVAFLTEGPESKMVGQEGMKARKFPTITLKGMVFAWMGDSESVDPKEDIPPAMFEEHNIHRHSFTMFDCNWVTVLENANDSHINFMVHRNALKMLGSRLGGRPRSPQGYRVEIINEKSAHYLRPGDGGSSVERYYYDENGDIPYQMYYPGVDGVWPLHRWRLLWTWFTDRKAKRRGRQAERGRSSEPNTPEDNEWHGNRLPGMSRFGSNGGDFQSTRWAVPVEPNLTRMVYLNVEWYSAKPGRVTRLVKGLTRPYRNWELNFNSRNQDYDAEKYVQYTAPEYMSGTDAVVVATRRLFTEDARDVKLQSERGGESTAPQDQTPVEIPARYGGAGFLAESDADD